MGLRLFKPGPVDKDRRPDVWRISWRRKIPVDPQAMETLVSQLTPEERVVTHAAAIATKEARVRLVDRRLLVIYLALILFVAYNVLGVEQTQRNCQHTQAAFDLVNGYFEKQIKTTQARTDITPALKKTLVANFKTSELHPLDCRIPRPWK